LRFTPCTDNGGDHIFAYRLYINEGTDGSAFHEPVSYITTDLDLEHTLDTTNEPLIAPGLIYQIKFACENSKGISLESDLLYASVVSAPAQASTPTVDYSLSSATSLYVKWTLNADSTAPGGLITGY
jgi:hypothetical protein